MRRFDGHTALITGAGRGIGAAWITGTVLTVDGGLMATSGFRRLTGAADL